MWLAVLSDQLRVIALVSRYLTNKLIRYRLLPDRRTFEATVMRQLHIIWYYLPFLVAIPESGVH